MIRTRFAPSPNGLLHLGHAFAAVIAHDLARAQGGEFLLRIEDIDGTRSRAELVPEILADLAWLGLAWDAPPVFQSRRLASYGAAGERLKAMGLPHARTLSSIRFSLGEGNTEEDVDQVIRVLPPLVEKLRSLTAVGSRR